MTNRIINIPRLAITAGEPAGIGPDICLMLAKQQHSAQLVIISDPELLAERAVNQGLNINFKLFDPSQRNTTAANELLVYPVHMNVSCTPGQTNIANASYVLKSLEKAVKGCLTGLFDAMVTAPINKAVINTAGISFSGHTEFLATQTHTDKAVMMLATEGLRVALATTHLPLSEVSAAISRSSLTKTLCILHKEMQSKFHIDHPCIAVCGLNPHAGENGHLGMEEINIIIPVINTLKNQGLNLIGPLPADTIFNPDNLNKYDVVLAMYHDQGLPVLKYKGFGKAVNITLGLPIIRTSVDHGTALDLAGTNKANPASLEAAITTALTMVCQ